jgi:hypothetical protein
MGKSIRQCGPFNYRRNETLTATKGRTLKVKSQDGSNF